MNSGISPISFTVIVAMFLVLAAPAQVVAEEKVSFEAMIKSVKQDPSSVDYTALRMAWAEYEGYDPLFFVSDEYKQSVDEIYKAEKSGSLVNVRRLCVDHFDKYFVDIAWNATCALAYRSFDSNAEEDFHTAIMRGLGDSVFSSGDGQSPETAFVLVSLSEERFVLHVLGVKKLYQALTEHNGKPYDMWSVEDPKTGNEGSVYFDIERPYSAY